MPQTPIRPLHPPKALRKVPIPILLLARVPSRRLESPQEKLRRLTTAQAKSNHRLLRHAAGSGRFLKEPSAG